MLSHSSSFVGHKITYYYNIAHCAHLPDGLDLVPVQCTIQGSNLNIFHNTKLKS
jgi:hypothetical protein